jgi:hypothetical protein
MYRKANLCQDILTRTSLSALSDLGECQFLHSFKQADYDISGAERGMHTEWKRHRDTAPRVLVPTA